MMECTGCGFAFSTERGAPGNFMLTSPDSWFMNHECRYCGTTTHVGSGTVQRLPKPRARRLVSR